MKLLMPLEPDTGAGDRDRAGKGGYPLASLERLLADCEDQPRWRDQADLCALYYDVGGLFSPEAERLMRANDLEPRKINLIGRVINGVLGQEAKTRRDPQLEPDDDDAADVCDVLNVRLKEAKRESLADMAISNGYASQVKTGIGWVEVSRCTDPLDYPYRVQEVHRSEMWWDWRAKRVDLKDARWVCRRQWRDLDEVVAQFPKHRQALEASAGNWSQWLLDDTTEERLLGADRNMHAWFRADRSFRVNRAEWIDGGRKRVRMYEVWYRMPAEVVCFKVGHRWIVYNDQNPAHQEAVARGMVKPEKRITAQVRRAIFAGPYRLVDEATTKRTFPYVPFFAFRADDDNTPYGLIHGMIAPQDEYNERRMRIQWMLKAQQLLIDNDALDTEWNSIDDIAATLMNPNMVAVLNSNRRNAKGMEFRNDFQLQKEQFEVMQDAKALIQDVPGIYSTQLGDAPAGVTSGVAINSLVEQGIVAMGELNDNYAHARRQVFDQLVDLIAEDHMEQDLPVTIGTGAHRRKVVLNTVNPETGAPMNIVRDAAITTGLAEVPATPAYMMQMSQQMGDMIRALANRPEAALIVPAWVENTSAFGPGRKTIADDMRRMSGMPVAGDRQGQQQWQQMQMQNAQKQQQMQEAALTAELESKDTTARLNVARADLAQAQTAKTLVEAERLATEPDEEALIAEAMNEAQAQPA